MLCIPDDRLVLGRLTDNDGSVVGDGVGDVCGRSFSGGPKQVRCTSALSRSTFFEQCEVTHVPDDRLLVQSYSRLNLVRAELSWPGSDGIFAGVPREEEDTA